MEERVILAIDLKSFYASVECKRRNLDPFSTPLVVADLFRGDGTIVLAASPAIKERYGVKSRCRLSEVDRNIPGLIVARPHMQSYLEESAKVNSVYLDYVGEEDLHVYSIDESFLDVTHYLKRGKDSPESYARKILSDIQRRLGLVATCGIGPNLFLAKCAMDQEAKKRKDRLAHWRKEDVPEKLWNVFPLSKLWGIGSRMERRLLSHGFATMGDIAVSQESYLQKLFGVIGRDLYQHAWGEDDAQIQEKYRSKRETIGVGEVLLRDYDSSELPTLVHDLVLELAENLARKERLAGRILLQALTKDGEAFQLLLEMEEKTDSSFALWEKIKDNLPKEEGRKYRRIHLVALSLFSRKEVQRTLFYDEEKDRREKRLEETTRKIRKEYGTNKAMPCSALLPSSTYWMRSQQIGGHHR